MSHPPYHLLSQSNSDFCNTFLFSHTLNLFSQLVAVGTSATPLVVSLICLKSLVVPHHYKIKFKCLSLMKWPLSTISGLTICHCPQHAPCRVNTSVLYHALCSVTGPALSPLLSHLHLTFSRQISDFSRLSSDVTSWWNHAWLSSVISVLYSLSSWYIFLSKTY